MSYVTGANQLYSFAAVVIPATANEDRNSVVMNQLGVLSETDQIVDGDFSAFSVFDGHNGIFASNLCAKQLHCRIGMIYSELLASWKAFQRQDTCGERSEMEDVSPSALLSVAAKSVSSNGEDEVKQSLFCEALHRAIEEIDEEVRANGDGGTTLTSLFLFPCFEENGQLRGVRLVNANIGDSRLIAITISPYDDQTSSGGNHDNGGGGGGMFNKDLNQSLHSFSSSEHNDRINRDQLSASAHSYFISPAQTTNTGNLTHSSKAATGSKSNKKSATLATSRAHPLSSDHKLSLDRERYRVENGVAIRPQALPWPLEPLIHCNIDETNVINTPGSDASAIRVLPASYSFPHDDDMPYTIAPSRGDEQSKMRRKDPLDDTHHDTEAKEQVIMTLSSILQESGAKVRMLSGLLPGPNQGNKSVEKKGELRNEEDNRPQVILPSHGHFVVSSSSLFFDRTNSSKHEETVVKHGRRLQEVSTAMTTLRPVLLPPYHNCYQVQSQKNSAIEVLQQRSLVVVNRQESFIACRAINQMSTIVRGPLAYHGRFGRSILMTRSIGDRLGPRGCIPCAELTTVFVPNDSTSTVRIVLATDGLWDVIDNDTVRRAAAWFKHQSSSALAIYLARKAVRRRAKRNLRRDDITVTVVDLFTNNTQGGEGNSRRLFLQNNKSVEGRPSKSITLIADDMSDKEVVISRQRNNGKVSPPQSSKENMSVIRAVDELDFTVHNIEPSQQSDNVKVVTNLVPIAASHDSSSSHDKKVIPVSSSTHTNHTASTESQQVVMDGYYHYHHDSVNGGRGPTISSVQPLPPEGVFGDRCIIS